MDVEDYDIEGVLGFLYWRGLGVKREIGFGRFISELCLCGKFIVFI